LLAIAPPLAVCTVQAIVPSAGTVVNWNVCPGLNVMVFGLMANCTALTVIVDVARVAPVWVSLAIM